ncbi:MAG: prepilin-type N-terminal cleavage/methylation domain-containing protein [Planctomycetota bacterium]|nr:prepilin-type N-terminal cleavage/methylation domain-containing protein [Planctomycetota bacterium]
MKKTQSGITLAEILIALVILAVGLTGVLSTFPIGQRFASECEENTVATLISSNNAAVIRGFVPGEVFTESGGQLWDGPQMYEEYDGPSSGMPAAPVFSQFNNDDNSFLPEIFPVGSDTILHDATTGHGNYEVSVSRVKTERGDFDIFLIVVHREGSDNVYHMLAGRGYCDDFVHEDE